jgi:probable HAF family extracellular repeat protein
MRARVSVVILLVAFLAFLQTHSVLTQPGGGATYVVADLGTLGGTSSEAYGINESGQVVGGAQRADGYTHAFFYDGSLHDLGTIGGPDSAALDVNRRGTVVGWTRSSIGNMKGFIYSAGTLQSLGTLGGSHSAAEAVNEFGEVVGSATTTNDAATRAFVYRNGTMSSLGTLGGANSAALDINNAAEIVGSASIAGNTATHAFLYRNGAMTDIGTLGGMSEAYGINDIGDVVGRSAVPSGAMHAFLYSGGVMTDIGTLGGPSSEAYAINDWGQVVGMADTAGGGGGHAFIYHNGGMTDLNARLPAGSGWVLETATSINGAGEIGGYGRYNGQRHAYRLMLPVTMRLVHGGAVTQQDSNIPRAGVQVGRSVLFVTSVMANEDANAQDVVFTDTMRGPVEIVSAKTYRGNPCAVSGATVTCRIPSLGPGGVFEDEVHVIVKVTAPGVFSHTSHATADNATPRPSTDTIGEDNVGIALKSFTLSAATVAGGKAVSARAELTALAPSGGAVVTLATSDPAIAPVPSPFVVQPPTAVRTFNIVPPVVSQPTTVTISATYGRVTISQTLTVVPPALSTVSLTRSTMIGSCQTATAKVTLTGAAPSGGARVALTSTTAGVHFPATVAVPAGATTASLTVTADAVHAISSGIFRAAYGGIAKQLSLANRPIYISAVTLTPSTVTGGAGVSGSATLECAAPPGGMAAALTSTNPSAAVPTASSMTFPAGSTSRSFAVRTNRVATATTLSIRASANSVTKSAALTVRP